MKTLHMIGNAHLDPVWLWDWREGFQENKATLKSALDRMEEFDEFIFTSSSAQFYIWVEENAPQMFEKIKQRVSEGRWIICGGWWVQPDCNIPSGESFARHALLAQNYFKEKFGVTAKTGYNVDSFGHNGMLPQILKKSGMDNYVFMRPMQNEKDMPTRAFWWESPDGSRVKTFRIVTAYNVWKDMEQHIDEHLEEYSEGVDHLMLFYGVGNHGGGPTITNIENVLKLREKRDDVDIVFSHPDKYFKAIKDCELPVVREELQHHAPGCYSVESMVKLMNRRGECALIGAETFSVMADRLQKTQKIANLNEAWQLLLFNQFHDTLAGSSIKVAYYDARNQLGEVVSVANRAENNAIQAISFDIDIPFDEQTLPIVIFNPHAFDVKTSVEFETRLFRDDFMPDGVAMRDCDGNSIPIQKISSHSKTVFAQRYTFIAEVPALGYALYIAENAKDMEPAIDDTPILENDLIKVEFDLELGVPCKITDKKTGTVIVDTPCTATVIKDETDTWGHTLTSLNEVVGEFKTTKYKVLNSGPVVKTIRFTSKYANSTLIQTYSLDVGCDRVCVKCNINWQEQRHALKLNFRLNTSKTSICIAEMPFGNIEKAQNSLEEPAQSWVDVGDDEMGLAILNDSRYSFDFRADTIGMTVLRSPVYAHHDPYELRDDEEYDYMDQGISEFSYEIQPHIGNWRDCDVVRNAMLLNQPLRTTFETFHSGSLPGKDGFISIDSKNIMMSALKPAYDSDGIVVRLYEAHGRDTDANITLFGTKIRRRFNPYEIVTFKISDNKVSEVNLTEWEV